MKNRISYIFILIVFISACATPEPSNKPVEVESCSEISKASFLLGAWESRSKDGVITETWQKINDSLFIGKNYFVTEKDTLVSEAIALEQRKEGLYLIPTVQGQNNNQPVEFKLTKSSPTHLVFENPKHDFPTKISYLFITKDSFHAEVSGIIHNRQTIDRFSMKRAM